MPPLKARGSLRFEHKAWRVAWLGNAEEKTQMRNGTLALRAYQTKGIPSPSEKVKKERTKFKNAKRITKNRGTPHLWPYIARRTPPQPSPHQPAEHRVPGRHLSQRARGRGNTVDSKDHNSCARFATKENSTDLRPVSPVFFPSGTPRLEEGQPLRYRRLRHRHHLPTAAVYLKFRRSSGGYILTLSRRANVGVG